MSINATPLAPAPFSVISGHLEAEAMSCTALSLEELLSEKKYAKSAPPSESWQLFLAQKATRDSKV